MITYTKREVQIRAIALIRARMSTGVVADVDTAQLNDELGMYAQRDVADVFAGLAVSLLDHLADESGTSRDELLYELARELSLDEVEETRRG